VEKTVEKVVPDKLNREMLAKAAKTNPTALLYYFVATLKPARKVQG